MSEKRGYPNPNYTEGDILKSIPMEAKTELILDEQLVEYIQKSAMFDCLTVAIRIMGKVDDDVVQAITGTLDVKEESETEKFRTWWHEERAKNEALNAKNHALEEEVKHLQEQINLLLPAVDEPEPFDDEEANG